MMDEERALAEAKDHQEIIRNQMHYNRIYKKEKFVEGVVKLVFWIALITFCTWLTPDSLVNPYL